MATGVDRHPGVRGRARVRAGCGALVVVCACLLTACAGAGLSGTPAQRMTSWLSASDNGASMGAVTDDIRAVDAGLAQHQPAGAIRTLCAVLATDAQAGNTDLPAPDSQVTDDLSDAYNDAYAAGNDCYSGAGGNAALLAKSAVLRRETLAELKVVVERITAISGVVPSTTTTTLPPGSGDDPFAG